MPRANLVVVLLILQQVVILSECCSGPASSACRPHLKRVRPYCAHPCHQWGAQWVLEKKAEKDVVDHKDA